MTSPTDSPGPDPGSKWDDREFRQSEKPPWLHRYRRELSIFAILSLLVLVVVLWLPRLINPVSLPATTAQDVDQQAASRAVPGASGNSLESPWEEAQITRARRQAQEILAKLLDRQSSLEKMHVNLWAADDYARALATAASGDEQYRLRQFDRAQENYRTALQQLDDLIKYADTVATGAMRAGAEALRQQNAQTALQQFELALAIDAGNADAQQGIERASVLDQVVEKLDLASNLAARAELDAALEQTRQALVLDPDSEPAQQQHERLGEQIRQRDYAVAMGEGLQRLQAHRYTQAAESFRKALNLKPGDPDAKAALANVGNQQLQARIQTTLSQAASLEQTEQWRQAQKAYEEVQSLDNSLVNARVGALRSRARADLDEQLQKLIDEPLRLSNAEVFREASGLLRDARQVQPRGERIDMQATRLADAMQQSQEPVTIQLQSDNQTEVTLYRVGRLGSFNRHQLDLKPGHYTLVGNRQGYRDVREEFTVQPGRQPDTIVIQCTEKISLDG